MKIGVVADTHIPLFAPAVPDELWKGLEGCDHLIHAGDFDSWETYEAFASRFPLTAVIGNRDQFPASDEVPERRILEVGGFRIGITHGFGPPSGAAKRTAKAWKDGAVDLLIFGHSHEAGVFDLDGLRLLNPGSPTDTHYCDCRTYAILELDDEIGIEIHNLP